MTGTAQARYFPGPTSCATVTGTTGFDPPLYRRLVTRGADLPAYTGRSAMHEGLSDPRLAAVRWRDLVQLSRPEIANELMLPLPWLAASLALAHQQLYPAALAASFMVFLTGLRLSHNAQHSAVGLGRRGTDAVLLVLSIVMLGSMHAVRFNHLRHHKYCMTTADVEGVSAAMSGLQAIAFGPLFPVLLHATALREGNARTRRWVAAELIANAFWIAAVLAWFGADFLVYHVAVMGAGQCLTAFFAVWTVHNH